MMLMGGDDFRWIVVGSLAALWDRYHHYHHHHHCHHRDDDVDDADGWR